MAEIAKGDRGIRGYPPDMTRAWRSGPLSARPVGSGVPENRVLLWRSRGFTSSSCKMPCLACGSTGASAGSLGRVGVAQRYRPLRHLAEPDLGGAPLDPDATSGACLERSLKHEAELAAARAAENWRANQNPRATTRGAPTDQQGDQSWPRFICRIIPGSGLKEEKFPRSASCYPLRFPLRPRSPVRPE